MELCWKLVLPEQLCELKAPGIGRLVLWPFGMTYLQAFFSLWGIIVCDYSNHEYVCTGEIEQYNNKIIHKQANTCFSLILYFNLQYVPVWRLHSTGFVGMLNRSDCQRSKLCGEKMSFLDVLDRKVNGFVKWQWHFPAKKLFDCNTAECSHCLHPVVNGILNPQAMCVHAITDVFKHYTYSNTYLSLRVYAKRSVCSHGCSFPASPESQEIREPGASICWAPGTPGASSKDRFTGQLCIQLD